MSRKITDVFFDLDHTLWDFDRNSILAFQRVFENHNITLDMGIFSHVYEPINFNYWKEYREDRITKDELRRGRFRDTFRIFGIHYSDEKLDELATAYIDELPKDNYLFEGARELLDHLAPKYRLHIITNGFIEVQHLKLKNSGIASYFESVTTSEEAGAKKPNPIIFKVALEKAGRLPESSMMIGDTFEADILGAEGVGMDTLFYNYRNEEVSSRYKVVDQIIDIKNYL